MMMRIARRLRRKGVYAVNYNTMHLLLTVSTLNIDYYSGKTITYNTIQKFIEMYYDSFIVIFQADALTIDFAKSTVAWNVAIS